MIGTISSNEWKAIGKLAKPTRSIIRHIINGHSTSLKDRWVLITNIDKMWLRHSKFDHVEHFVVKFLDEGREKQVHFEDPKHLHTLFEIKWQ